MPTTEDEVRVNKVITDALIDTLGVDEEDLQENAHLFSELGAESVDFLDIIYRLEKNLISERLVPVNTRLRRSNSAFSELQDILPGEAKEHVTPEGKLKDEAKAIVKANMPYVDPDNFFYQHGLIIPDPTVGDITRYVLWVIEKNRQPKA
jgi:hypothetical protein